ncbi:MAG: hypothetical protein LBI56_03555 [Puniceicoccales bacterium]|nr:hypothetical protein [Puniceicoccales bacterium]
MMHIGGNFSEKVNSGLAAVKNFTLDIIRIISKPFVFIFEKLFPNKNVNIRNAATPPEAPPPAPEAPAPEATATAEQTPYVPPRARGVLYNLNNRVERFENNAKNKIENVVKNAKGNNVERTNPFENVAASIRNAPANNNAADTEKENGGFVDFSAPGGLDEFKERIDKIHENAADILKKPK